MHPARQILGRFLFCRLPRRNHYTLDYNATSKQDILYNWANRLIYSYQLKNLSLDVLQYKIPFLNIFFLYGSYYITIMLGNPVS